jgi:hypothetical protein
LVAALAATKPGPAQRWCHSQRVCILDKWGGA